jgi:hypothetical protein
VAVHAELGLPLWAIASLCVAVLIVLFVSVGSVKWRGEPLVVSERRAVQLIAIQLIAIGVAAAYGFSNTTWGNDLFGSTEGFARSAATTITASYIIVIYILVYVAAARGFAERVELEPRGVLGHLSVVGAGPAVAFALAAVLGEIAGRRDIDIDAELMGWVQVVALLIGHGVGVVAMGSQCRWLIGSRDHIASEAPLVVALCASMLFGLWVFVGG